MSRDDLILALKRLAMFLYGPKFSVSELLTMLTVMATCWKLGAPWYVALAAQLIGLWIQGFLNAVVNDIVDKDGLIERWLRKKGR